MRTQSVLFPLGEISLQIDTAKQTGVFAPPDVDWCAIHLSEKPTGHYVIIGVQLLKRVTLKSFALKSNDQRFPADLPFEVLARNNGTATDLNIRVEAALISQYSTLKLEVYHAD